MEGDLEIDRHLDINRAVNTFLTHYESLSRLPFVTDTEVEQLFGTEITSALAELDLYNQKEKNCSSCTNRCCRLVKCEIYAAELSQCPVQPFRPLLCRMHFCNKFSLRYRILVKEIGDVFLNSLAEAERLNSPMTRFMDSPPLSNLAPAVTAAIISGIAVVQTGRREESAALKIIHSEMNKYRRLIAPDKVKGSV